MSATRRWLSRWFLPLVAIASICSTLAVVSLETDGPLLDALLQGAFAIVLAGVLFVVGYRYVTATDLPDTQARTVAGWTLAGFGLLLVMNVWFRFLNFTIGAVNPLFAAVTSVTAGTLGGAVLGISVARAHRRHAARKQALADYHEIFETVEDAILVHDAETFDIVDANPKAVDLFGYTVSELRGMDVMDFTASHPDFDETVVETKLTRALAGETERFDWTIEHKNGSQRWVEVVLKTATIRDDQRILAVVRDISGRKEYEQALEAAEARFRALTENASFAVVTIDESSTIQYTNDAVEELFGHQPEALVGAPLTTLMPERFRDMHYAGFERYLSEGTRAIDWDGIELPGLHADGHEFPMEITFGEFAVDDEHLFTGILRDITERKRQEDAVETLHESTRELIQEPDRERVAETAITTVRTVLDRPICAIWLHEPADDQLDPVAVSDEATELFDSIPTYSADDPSLTWQAFQNGEIRVCDDLSAVEDAFNPDTPARSEMILPLGDHGVMTIGSTDVDAFTDADRSLATLLATNTEVALERANREQALSRQNDRLEFLNSLLRHHILNGMTVIQGQTDILADETGDDVKPHVETIRSRNRDIVDLVQRVRALLDVLTSEETASLEPTDLSATLEGELERLRDTYPAVEFEASIPPDVTVTANDSLAEVLGSVLTNGVDHNESDTPRVTVTVTERSEQVRVRIADNGSGVPDGLKESIFRREEIGHVKSSDSDFGLFFAETMLSEYGGDIRVEDNDPAGAVFVIDLLRP